MALSRGTTLGSYEIGALIGAGGMGEVYRARDTKLGRDVAIKILPEAFTVDKERVARFQREARTLAVLNHPNIGAIYGLEETAGKQALILELVEGPTIADRITQSPIPIDEALPIARQIAEALEAAHEHGIVHRDLKPANIKLRPDGIVKVLDFGLAKAAAGESSPDSSQSPTVTGLATRDGIILGTAAYMSPEQARGKPVDKRTDIWAFGCVLYEMLTGHLAFSGETVSDTIAAILGRDADWERLPPSVPPNIKRLMQRCLEKNPKRRVHDIADARIELDDSLSGAASSPLTTARASSRAIPPAVQWTLVALIGAVIGGLVVWSLQPGNPVPAKPVARFVIPLKAGDQLAMAPNVSPNTIALSPDGAYLAYTLGQAGSTRIYLRALSEPEARPIANNAHDPFFSPDSQWLGFSADGKLKKVPVRGGQPMTISDASGSRGASWGDDGSIIFAPLSRTGLSRVNAAGGVPQPITTLDGSREETSHRTPWLLPGGKSVLYVAEGTNRRNALMVLSLQSHEQRVLVEDANLPRYVPSGHLVYAQQGTIMAVAFDPVGLKITGTPVPVLEEVARFGTSEAGSLVYTLRDDDRRLRTLVWMDRQGQETALSAKPGAYLHPKLSPDGQRVLVEVDPEVSRNLSMYDIAGGTLTPVTFGGSNLWPVWTADGLRITYASNRPGTSWDIFWKPADGGGVEEALVQRELTQLPRSWSPDGQLLAFTESHPTRGQDIWLFSLKDRRSYPWIQTNAYEEQPAFSPDGHWLAYVSNESGRQEVYVGSASGPTGKWQVSTGGGVEPLWAPGGRELFYRSDEKMFVVDVVTQPAFATGQTRVLFEGVYELTGTGTPNYDVTRDGQRFLMVKPPARNAAATQLNVVQNWFEELKRLVPTK